MDNLEQSELKITSFVIKVWIERPVEHPQLVSWHSQITHVESGRMTYVKDWREALDFIQAHLLPLGVKPDRERGLRAWLRQWRNAGGNSDER